MENTRMKPTDILAEEHRLIEQALECWSKAIARLEGGDRPPRGFFEKAIEFANAFVDKFHHFKEEYLMFGLLAQKNNGEIDGQIESLRHQHERGRGCINEMGRCLDGYAKGGEAQVAAIVESLSTYVSTLRQHLHTEDHIFYPMAEAELTDAEQRTLVEQFQDQDRKTGGKTMKSCQKLVAEMESLV